MDAHRQALAAYDPEIDAAIAGEERRQVDGVEMIPSENYTYPEVLAALGSVLTNKYAEGYPGPALLRRPGVHRRDRERSARERACALFRCRARQRAAAVGLADEPGGLLRLPASPATPCWRWTSRHGGHLTHGAPVSHMGKVFNFVRYKTHPDQGGAHRLRRR